MPTSVFILGISVVAASAITATIWAMRRNRAARRKRRGFFQARPRLDRNTWYAEHYEPTGLPYEASVAVAECLAGAFRCNATQFYAADSFADELAFTGTHFLGLDCDDEMELFEECAIPGILSAAGVDAWEKADLTQLATLADLIRWCMPYISTEIEAKIVCSRQRV